MAADLQMATLLFYLGQGLSLKTAHQNQCGYGKPGGNKLNLF
jgi:hypothetical protein